MQWSLAPSTACVRLIAGQGGAAGAGIALVARRVGRVAEISAAGALQDVAAEARHVADLLAGGELQRLRDDRILRLNVAMIGGFGHAHQRAEPQAVLAELDAAVRCASSGLMSMTVAAA